MSDAREQNYKNHRQFVFGYHVVLTLLGLAAVVGGTWALVRSFLWVSHRMFFITFFIVVVIVVIEGAYLRLFALKAQDRAIRAEENLRHFALYGKLLDSRLTTRQIIGLRFASDEEFGELAQRAAEEGMSEDQIKRAVKNWRADWYRV